MTVVVMLVAEDKAGACPVQDARTLCAHQCKVDTHCQGDKKCCSAGGCNVCASPAPPAGGSGAMLNLNNAFTGLSGGQSQYNSFLSSGSGSSSGPTV